jgi:hypothetical protein
MAAPAVGSRWRARTGSVYEYLGEDTEEAGCYCHTMRLVEPSAKLAVIAAAYRPGWTMHVELPWFYLAAKQVS